MDQRATSAVAKLSPGSVPSRRSKGATKTVGIAMPIDPSGASVADVWNENYSKYKHMWGINPSLTASMMISALENLPNNGVRRTVLDLGCGYGRDTMELARKGLDATGVDIARKGLELAYLDYRQAMQEMRFAGSAVFKRGTIQSVLENNIGHLDGISTHRTLHLMNQNELGAFAACAGELLRPEGFLTVGARSIDDFKPDEMEWIEGKEGVTATYKNRTGHIINFMSEEILLNIFEKDFNFLEIKKGEEIESKRNGKSRTNLIFMLARRRNEAATIHAEAA